MSGGYLDFTAGSVLTAAQLEQYCELQGILRFASAAARDSALSAVLEEGLFAYLVDTNTVTVYTGSAWSTVGPVHGALTSYTPTWTQSGTVTNTIEYSRYSRIGRRVEYQFALTATGSGTGANVMTLTLPVTAAYASAATAYGCYTFSDASVPSYWTGMIVLNSTTTMKFISSATGSSFTFLGTTNFTAAVASGDVLTGTIIYEAASDA